MLKYNVPVHVKNLKCMFFLMHFLRNHRIKMYIFIAYFIDFIDNKYINTLWFPFLSN